MGETTISIGKRLRGKLPWPRRDARQPGVPVRGSRDLPPKGGFGLAWEYLRRDSRLKRREITIKADLFSTDERMIAIDCVLPDGGIGDRDWYLPVTFLERWDIAPYLRVTGRDGAVISIPTRQQNMALTKLALAALLDAKEIELSPESKQLMGEVVTREPLAARICRYKLEEEEPAAAAELEWLLKLLEDHFLLWVPVRGAPLSQQHISVDRRQIRFPDPLFSRRRQVARTRISTALGPVLVGWMPASGRWILNRKLALERLLHLFALRPFEADIDEFEAARFDSCHLCFTAPAGFLVRNVKAAEIPPRRLSRHQPHVAIQGYDHDLAHVHLSKEENPRFRTRLTLGLRGGMTTLWMLATVLTSALLWIVHHHSSYGVPMHHFPSADPHFVSGAAAHPFVTARHHVKHIAIGANNRQIAAAVLLVGPAFASAWSLRADGGKLLRSYLAGSRVLLLLSAALSVATALALANILPTAAGGRYEGVEIYAAASYFVAVPMVIAWLISSGPVWALFRTLLRKEEHNLLTIMLAAAPILAVGMLPLPPGRIDGFVLLACGLALAAVSANSVGEPLFESRTLYRPLAGFGSLLPFFFAGDFLGFYADRIPVGIACGACTVVGLLLFTIALRGWGSRRRARKSTESPLPRGGARGANADPAHSR